MRSKVAPRLQFTHRRKASQAVGALIGTPQTALSYGEIHTPTQAVSAYAEQSEINITKSKTDTMGNALNGEFKNRR